MSDTQEAIASTSKSVQTASFPDVSSRFESADKLVPKLKKLTLKEERQAAALTTAKDDAGDRCFKIEAADFHVGQFLKYSEEHTSKLSQAFESLAKVTVHHDQNEEKIEFHFEPIQTLPINEQDFQESCKKKLDLFLANYSCKERLFNSNEVAKAFSSKSNFFTRKVGEDDDTLYSYWDQARKKLTVVGLKMQVEGRMLDIDQGISSRLNPSQYVYSFSSKQPIAKFLSHSATHMKELSRSFRETAKLEFTTPSNVDSFNLHLQCTAAEEVRLEPHDFRKVCQGMLDEFLQKYGFSKKSFNPYQLEEVRSKIPDFFKQKINNEDTITYWQNDTFIVAGLKKELENQIQLVVNKINEIAPRDMKQGYELVIESDDPSVAKFIYRSVNKHLVRFNNFFKNGIRTWIEPHTYSVHFKADKELSQFDIRCFEKKCTQSLASFVRKYDSWSAVYSPETIENSMKKHQDLFKNTDDDWWFEVVDETHVSFVGLKPYFYAKRNLLRNALDDAEKEVQKKNPSVPTNKLPTYRYEPNEKSSRLIIKHIFQSPLDLAALQHVVGPHIQFSVFPTEMDAKGIRFKPREGVSVNEDSVSEDFYKNTIREILPAFFKRFLVCTKRFEADKFEQILSVVYRIGEESENIIDRMISMYKEENCLDIVGPSDVIYEIAVEVDGDNCEQEEFNLQEDDPSELPITSDQPQPHISRSDSDMPGSSTSQDSGPSTSLDPESSDLHTPSRVSFHKPESSSAFDTSTSLELPFSSYLPLLESGSFEPSSSLDSLLSTSQQPIASVMRKSRPSSFPEKRQSWQESGFSASQEFEPSSLPRISPTLFERVPMTSKDPGPLTSRVPRSSTSRVPGSSTSELGSSTSRELGSSTSELGSSTSRELGSSTSRELGSLASRELGSSTSRELGSSTSRELGSSTSRELGSSTSRELGSSTSRELGSLTSRELGSSISRELGSLASRELGSSTSRELGSSTSRELGSSTSRELGSSTSRELGSSTSRELGSSTSRELGSSTSRELGSSTSRELGSSTSRELGSSISRELGSSTSRELRSSTFEHGSSTCDGSVLSTSDEPAPSTADKPAPSTSNEPASSTSDERAPSTSNERAPSTSDALAPSTSRKPVSSTSYKPDPSASDEPSPSTSRMPFS